MMYVSESNLASVPVKDTTGREAGRLYFIPNDVGLHYRAIEAQKRMMASIVEPLRECTSLLPDGRGADPESEAVVQNAERNVSEIINSICGIETAAEAFREHNPFAAMPDGTFWVSVVLEALNAADAHVLENLKKITGSKKWRKH